MSERDVKRVEVEVCFQRVSHIAIVVNKHLRHAFTTVKAQLTPALIRTYGSKLEGMR